jgi:hypothetical protein
LNNTNLYWSLLSATGMMLVAIAAIVFWRRTTHVAYRWFWIGAGLWTVAVAIKFAIAAPTSGPVFRYLAGQLPGPAFILVGGLYGGLQSSLCEIGLTWLAVLIWSQLGRNAERAIGIGIGAGAFEAFLLGLAAAIGVSATVADARSTELLRQQVDAMANINPVFWLIASVERVIAILCHASTRALVLLGTIHGRPWMVFWGFAIFTLLDGIVTAAHLTGMLGKISMWWIELTILPLALVSIPILWWCYSRWGESAQPDVPTPADSLPLTS